MKKWWYKFKVRWVTGETIKQYTDEGVKKGYIGVVTEKYDEKLGKWVKVKNKA